MTSFHSKWSLRTVAALALAAGGAIGCAQSGNPSAGAQQQAASDDPSGPEMQQMHEAAGPELLLVVALHHLDLKPEQRTAIEHAHEAIGHRHAEELSVELAAEVRAGTIDENRVLAKVDPGAASTRNAAIANALDTLHATLTADQRRSLVDTIVKHVGEREAAHEAMVAGPSGLPEHLVAGLGLKGDQHAQIARILAARATGDVTDRAEAFHSALRAHVQAFAADQFDAAAFVAPNTHMRGHIQQTIHTLAAILPVLDASQRETLATVIEARHGGER